MSNARKLADNLPSVGQLSGRNVIVNGGMNVSSRGTSFVGIGNAYSLDRFAWYAQNTGSGWTLSQSSVTDLAGFANALKVDCTTADTSTASNEQAYVSYKAEGQDLQRFQKGHATALGFTLSFYVKTNKSGVYTVKMYDRDNNRDVSGSYTVADANWNRYTISFPADTTGKFDDDNASSLEIFFNLVAGSDTTGGTLNTAWRTNSDASSASGQVNFADSTSNNWEITGIQLEAGSQSSPFEHEHHSVTLAKCQRYYFQSPSFGTSAAGTSADVIQYHGSLLKNASRWHWLPQEFPVVMRIAPTVTTHDGTTEGKIGHWTSTGGSSTVGHNPWQVLSKSNHIRVNEYATGGIYGFYYNYKADAEL